MVWVAAVGRVVERDAQPDLDVPAGDLDVFDEQPEQVLALGGVELVDDGGHAGGEALDAVAEPVAAGEVGAFGGEAGALVLEFALPGGDRGGAALQLGHVDQSGLVEVDEPVVLAAGSLEFAVQAIATNNADSRLSLSQHPSDQGVTPFGLILAAPNVICYGTSEPGVTGHNLAYTMRVPILSETDKWQ